MSAAEPFALSKPITAHGEEVRELTLAEPTTKDVRELGYPFTALPDANGEIKITLYPEIAARYITRLARVPMSSVDQLAIGDLFGLHMVIVGFFGQGPDSVSN